jgi:hypothetical protein
VRGAASVSTQSAYVTASWDGSLRLWRWPTTASPDGSPTTTAERRSGALLLAQASAAASERGALGGEDGKELDGERPAPAYLAVHCAAVSARSAHHY